MLGPGSVPTTRPPAAASLVLRSAILAPPSALLRESRLGQSSEYWDRVFARPISGKHDPPIVLRTEFGSALEFFFRGLLLDKIAEYSGLVHGVLGLQEFGYDGLLEATALFRGLRRPLNEHGEDGNFLVYVSSPPTTYHYQNRAGLLASNPLPRRKPRFNGRDAVFVTYVHPLDEPEVLDPGTKAHGYVRYWEWVAADPQNAELPDRWNERYKGRLW